MFKIEPDPARALLRVRVGGFFSPEEMRAFHEESMAGVANLVSRCGQFDLLVLIVDGMVQDKQITGMALAGAQASAFQPRRKAIVVPPGLIRLQVRRVFGEYGLEPFETEEAALDWLADGQSG